MGALEPGVGWYKVSWLTKDPSKASKQERASESQYALVMNIQDGMGAMHRVYFSPTTTQVCAEAHNIEIPSPKIKRLRERQTLVSTLLAISCVLWHGSRRIHTLNGLTLAQLCKKHHWLAVTFLVQTKAPLKCSSASRPLCTCGRAS